MFQIGDWIVHPTHGVGIVESVVSRKIGGVVRDYYVLKLPSGGMQVLVPIQGCAETGVRPIVERDEAERVLSALPTLTVKHESNWNKRYRDNLARLKSGELLQVAQATKNLTHLEKRRALSNDEMRLLRIARQILLSEFVLSGLLSREEAVERVNAALSMDSPVEA